MYDEFLTISEARKKIEILRKNKIVVLYIERLVQQKDKTFVADIDGIADFSDASVEESYRASLSFFSEYGKDTNEFFVLTY